MFTIEEENSGYRDRSEKVLTLFTVHRNWKDTVLEEGGKAVPFSTETGTIHLELVIELSAWNGLHASNGKYTCVLNCLKF